MEYNREEVFKSTLAYFRGDELAANVWINKYALKDSSGKIYELNPDDMHKRLANEIARIESNYPNPLTVNDIYELIKDFKFIIPQGGPMSGIGNTMQTISLSNCFVVGNDADSYGGITLTDQEQIQLMKRRGGVGHDLSHIRPKGSPVKNSALTSTGVVPFMTRFSNSTREVAQDGRRGALMLSISIKHPDSEDFIDAKMESGKITGANVSVKIDDEFMNAVKNSGTYQQMFPINSDVPKLTKDIDAKVLFDKIIHNAWKSAEPGVLFWDTIINESVPDCYADLGYKTTSTNPCGEIPLCPYDSCRLIAINLYSYVVDPFTENAVFDFKLFERHAEFTQRIMDDIIDLEIEKIDAIIEKIKLDPEEAHFKRTELEMWEKIRAKTKQGRRTGIGVTAEGDMLAAMGLTYGTAKATEFSELIHKTLAISVYKASSFLAKERGSFEIYDFKREANNPFIQRLFSACPDLKDLMKENGRRNIALLTIAPTGTTSLMTQTTSGIEPVFKTVYMRRRKINPNDKDAKSVFIDDVGDHWEEYPIFHPKFLKWAKIKGHDVDVIKNLKSEELDELVKQSPYFKASSADVDWVEKVKMQGAIQKWIDHSISVTVNLPADATEEIVANVYMSAWESGCKGVTVYREGSRAGVLVSKEDKKQQSLTESMREHSAPKRPKMIECDIVRFNNQHDKWIGFVGLLDKRPYEIFTGKSESFPVPIWVEKGSIRKVKDNGNGSRYDFVYTDKDGYEQEVRGLNRVFDKEYWNIAKTFSGLLRHGMPIVNVYELVCSLKFDGEGFATWKTGLKRMIKKYIDDGTVAKGEICPNCKSEHIVFQDGCLSCKACGFSKCDS